MLNFVLQDIKQTTKQNIRRTHLFCTATMNRMFNNVTENLKQNLF